MPSYGAEPIGERPRSTAPVPAKPDHGDPDDGLTYPRRSKVELEGIEPSSASR